MTRWRGIAPSVLKVDYTCNESVLTDRESGGRFLQVGTVDNASVAFHRRAFSVFGAALFGALCAQDGDAQVPNLVV